MDVQFVSDETPLITILFPFFKFLVTFVSLMKAKNKQKNRKAQPRKRADGKVVGKRSKPFAPSAMPVARGQGVKTKAPKMRNIQGGTLVCHQEYLLDVPATTAFSLPANQVIVVQPGLVDSMPWLAQVANSYEMYRFRKLEFRYRNRNATSNNGSVYMAFQNDSDDALFGSKSELMGYEGSQEDAIYKDQTFRVVIADYMKKYFIRSQSLPEGTNAQVYDVGLFSITAMAGTAIAIVGDLLVYYEVELFKPKITQVMGSGYYANWTNTGLGLTTLQLNPWTTGLVNVSNIEPYIEYFTLSELGGGPGAGDGLLLPMQGIFLITSDVNATGVVPTSTLAPVTALGANLQSLDFKATIKTGASDVITWFTIVAVNKSGSGAANQFALTYTGGTGMTGWVSDTWVVQVNPSALGAGEVLRHPSVHRKPRVCPSAVSESKERKERVLDIPDQHSVVRSGVFLPPLELPGKNLKSSQKGKRVEKRVSSRPDDLDETP